MKIHKEGYRILIVLFIALAATNCAVIIVLPNSLLSLLFSISSIIIFLFCLIFFRFPNRIKPTDINNIYAPADGKVVVVEKVYEEEYYKSERIQVSIFMSAFNIHANWTPIDGIIKQVNHYPGKYYAAWNPKSSKNNERTSLVIEGKNDFSLLVRQIAGVLARRIVTYPENNQKMILGDQVGFIKFGSRVDLFLPIDTDIKVCLNQKVTGNNSIIARIP